MKLYDTVRIKKENIIGTVVDISRRNGTVYYVVESSEKGSVKGKDGGCWSLFDCKIEDIEEVTEGAEE